VSNLSLLSRAISPAYVPGCQQDNKTVNKSEGWLGSHAFSNLIFVDPACSANSVFYYATLDAILLIPYAVIT
jgi:hypothetical protein